MPMKFPIFCNMTPSRLVDKRPENSDSIFLWNFDPYTVLHLGKWCYSDCQFSASQFVSNVQCKTLHVEVSLNAEIQTFYGVPTDAPVVKIQ